MACGFDFGDDAFFALGTIEEVQGETMCSGVIFGFQKPGDERGDLGDPLGGHTGIKGDLGLLGSRELGNQEDI